MNSDEEHPVFSLRTFCASVFLSQIRFREDTIVLDMNKKLEEICRLFRIEGTYVGYETIQVGNVNKTYECKFILPE